MTEPLTEAELDLLDDMSDSAYANITAMADQSLWIRACKATPRLVTELREARDEIAALRALVERLIVPSGPATPEEVALIRSILGDER